jgi:lipid II:glycine glycyltransferase (peptidoglycan interpeptide bridge formation enzyme)
MEDLRQAKEYAKYMESLGWVVEEGMFVKKLPLLPWSFIKYQRADWPVDFEKVEKVVKKYRAIQVKIEPNVLENRKIEKEFERRGYKFDRSAMLPTKTVWLDLRKSEKQLLEEMHHKTRYNIKKYQEKVEIIAGDKVSDKQIKDFFRIYQKNLKKQQFWGLSFKQLKNLFGEFKNKSYLLWVKDLGGLMILVHGKTAYYSHNAATREGRKRFVPTLLTWEAIKLAKKLGDRRFDFEGIADERFPVTNKWLGFSRFKKSFGGNKIEYIGSFSKFNKEALWPLK